MTSQLPHFRCLVLSCKQQQTTENGAAVTSLGSFLFRDDFSNYFDIGGKESFGGSSSNYEITTFVLHVSTYKER